MERRQTNGPDGGCGREDANHRRAKQFSPEKQMDAPDVGANYGDTVTKRYLNLRSDVVKHYTEDKERLQRDKEHVQEDEEHLKYDEEELREIDEKLKKCKGRGKQFQ